MKKHFITVKISFLTFLRHCIKQYPSIRFCAVSMADQAVSAFLSKDRLQKKFAENIVVKRKESSCSRTSGAIRSWYQMQSWFGWTRWAVSGGKKQRNQRAEKRMPPTQQDSVRFYTIKLKRYDCGGLLQQKDSWWSLSDGGQEIRYHKNTYEHLTNFSNLSYKRDKSKNKKTIAFHILYYKAKNKTSKIIKTPVYTSKTPVQN